MSRALLRLMLLALGAAAANSQHIGVRGIASATIRVSSLQNALGFYRDLLGYPVAFELKDTAGKPTSVFLQVNDSQFLELTPDLTPSDVERMTHISLEISRLEQRPLVALSTPPVLCNDGTRAAHLNAPSKAVLSFVEYRPESLEARSRRKSDGASPISSHLWHAGIVVKRDELQQALAFYTGQLGFREFWRGGPEGAPLAWINLSVGGERGDYLELMLTDPNPDRKRLGSMEHICLQVPDIQAAWGSVQRRDASHTQTQSPRIGRNGKWQLNLFDPDGTRVELMELQPASGSGSEKHAGPV